jgi:hypothetical protein
MSGRFCRFPDRVRPGSARWLTEPHSLIAASIVSRRGSDLACGMGLRSALHVVRHRGASSAAAPAGKRSVQTGGIRQPHPHLHAHVFQITGFTREDIGFVETFVHPGAPNPPPSPNTPEPVHRRALVPHGTHRYVPPPGSDLRTHHDRHLARACPAAPGDTYRQPRRSDLDRRPLLAPGGVGG